MAQNTLNELHAERVAAVKNGLKNMQEVHDLCNRLHADGFTELADLIRSCLIHYLYLKKEPNAHEFLQIVYNKLVR